MILILAEMIVGSEADALALCAAARECRKQTHLELGAVEYEFSRDIVDPLMIRVIERWKDPAALRSHLRTPHLQAFMKAMEAVNVKSTEAKVYDISNQREFDEREFG